MREGLQKYHRQLQAIAMECQDMYNEAQRDGSLSWREKTYAMACLSEAIEGVGNALSDIIQEDWTGDEIHDSHRPAGLSGVIQES